MPKSPLHIAAEQGNIDLVRQYINACPDREARHALISAVDDKGNTPLHAAMSKHPNKAAFGARTVAALLVRACPIGQRKAYINQKNNEGIFSGNSALDLCKDNFPDDNHLTKRMLKYAGASDERTSARIELDNAAPQDIVAIAKKYKEAFNAERDMASRYTMHEGAVHWGAGAQKVDLRPEIEQVSSYELPRMRRLDDAPKSTEKAFNNDKKAENKWVDKIIKDNKGSCLPDF